MSGGEAWSVRAQRAFRYFYFRHFYTRKQILETFTVCFIVLCVVLLYNLKFSMQTLNSRSLSQNDNTRVDLDILFGENDADENQHGRVFGFQRSASRSVSSSHAQTRRVTHAQTRRVTLHGIQELSDSKPRSGGQDPKSLQSSNDTKVKHDDYFDNIHSRRTKFEFASNLGQLANEKIMTLIRKDMVDTFEVDFGRGNNSIDERGGGGGDDDNDRGITFPPFIETGKDDDPGEHGKSVVIRKESLSPESRRKRKEDFSINNFDIWASRKISLHRRLDDTRPQQCRNQTNNATSLPGVSVVMVFYNEAWTTLLRSVHSILDRTPATALKEIVLLDDASQQAHLGRPLEKYLRPLAPKVRLIRSTKRLGLIKARNLGFLYAKADIIVFLDSHIECFPGWLEPLVTPIVLDPRTVTFPIIPVIHKSNFGVLVGDRVNVGNVRVHDLIFYWTPVTDHPGQLYHESPVMPGGLYAVSRAWFHHLGAYDPQLLLWGGENVEISFKIWMCGGRILLSTCSRVGHVFRLQSPLKRSDYEPVLSWNPNRVAEVWMDQYKHFYYEKHNYDVGPMGDVSVQKALRRGLLCKDFKWYLDNVNDVMKKQMDPRSVYFGQMKNANTSTCLSADDPSGGVTLTSCDHPNSRQLWQLRTSGHLQCYDSILSIQNVSIKVNAKSRHLHPSSSYKLSMGTMTTSRQERFAIFEYDQSRRLVHRQTGLCLDIVTSSKQARVGLSQCDDDVSSQVWKMQPRTEFRAFHKEHTHGIEW